MREIGCGDLDMNEVSEAKPKEPSLDRKRLRKYTKITALLGLVIAVLSFPLAIAFSPSLLIGVLIGICIAVSSGVARTFEKGQILRRVLGTMMIAVPVVTMFLGGPPFLPLMYAPGLIIAIFLLKSNRRGARSGLIVLFGAFAYAALWLMGLFPGALIDGSWTTAIYMMWSAKFFYENGLQYLALFWTMQLEKVLALTAGIFLLLTSTLSRIRAPTRKTTIIAFAISLIPLLLLAPPPPRGIEGSTIFKVTVLAVDETPVSKLAVYVGRDIGPPPEGGTGTTNENGITTFYIKPDSYVLYFNQTAYPTYLEYPSRIQQVNILGGKVNELTILLNYSFPQNVFSSNGISIWLTRVNNPNAVHLRRTSSSEQTYIWVQGQQGNQSEFQVFLRAGTSQEQMGPKSTLDLRGAPVSMGMVTGGSPSNVVFEVRIQDKVVASVGVLRVGTY